MCKSRVHLGQIAILWRGDEPARRSATPESSRFKAIFAALADVGVDAEAVVCEDDVLDIVRAQLTRLDGVLVWVNPIHEGRNRANLDALLRDVAARGVWVSAHPDVVEKMGTKEVLHRTRTMSWGCNTAFYRTVEAMRTELPARLATGPRVIKRRYFCGTLSCRLNNVVTCVFRVRFQTGLQCLATHFAFGLRPGRRMMLYQPYSTRAIAKPRIINFPGCIAQRACLHCPTGWLP